MTNTTPLLFLILCLIECDFKVFTLQHKCQTGTFTLGAGGGCGRMKKLCAKCGIIFDTDDKAPKKFCSTKCEKMFAESSLAYVKRGQTQRKTYAADL